MKVTNVLSSHYPGAFTQVLLDTFNQALEEAGHEQVSFDLYGLRFDPVMSGDDFNQFFGKPIPDEILAFQKRLRESEVMVFFYPVWWNDMPAIMKGWIDRVFTKGFAYRVEDGKTLGCLPLRKVVLVCTLGNKKENVAAELEQAMRIKEKQGVFGYCGVAEVAHLFLYEVDGSPEVREEAKRRVRELASDL